MTKPIIAFAIACLTLACAQAAGAAGYPDKPVTIIVPFVPGGSSDITARSVAPGLTKRLGVSFVVENKPGANGAIAAQELKRTDPDGYTIMVGSIGTFAINEALYRKLAYTPTKDFAYLTQAVRNPNVLVAAPNFPASSVKELVAYAKQHPGKVSFASSGTGSAIHMSCELFKIQTGTDILHVPYRGSGPAMADLLGGQVHSAFDNMPTVLANVRAGKLRALGVTTSARSPYAPDIPTLAESGLPNFSVQAWFGLFAPGGTDPALVDRINGLINKAMQQPQLKASYEKSGVTIPAEPNSSQAFSAFVRAEVDKWADVVKKSGAKIE